MVSSRSSASPACNGNTIAWVAVQKGPVANFKRDQWTRKGASTDRSTTGCRWCSSATTSAPWLNGGGTGLLKPAANDVLQRWPVSERVNSSRRRPTTTRR